MKKFTVILALALTLASNLAFASANGSDLLVIGKKGSSANKTVQMGAGRIVWNQSSSKMTFSNDSGSSFKNFGSGGGGGSGINLLTDFNFDFEGGTANWTASGGSFSAAVSGSNLIFDVQSGVFNSSAASQTLSSQSVTVPQGFKSANGSAGCYFKTAATDYKVQVFDGTNVLAEKLIPPIAGAPQKIGVSFIFPGSGSVRLRVISASDAADLAIDNCFLGENATVQLSQASYVGSIDVTGCTGSFGWTTGGFTDQSGATACSYTATGALSAPSSATIPGFSAALEAGEYFINIADEFNLAATSEVGLRITNGTISSRELTTYHSNSNAAGMAFGSGTFSFSVPNALGPLDYKLQAAVLAGTSFSANATSGDHLVMSVYRYPTKTQEAMTFGSAAYLWQGTVSGNTALTSVTTADFPGTAAVTQVANTNAGTVVGASVGLGVSFVPSGNGTYRVCAMGSYGQSNTNASSALTLTDGADNALGPQMNSTNAAAGGSKAIPLCAHVPVTSVAPVTVKVRAAINGGSITPEFVNFLIEKVTSQLPAPVLVGGVVTPLSGVMNVVTAIFAGNSSGSVGCTTDPCTIVRQSGGITSVNRAAAGVYNVNFSAGTFSAAPVCTCMANNTATAATSCAQNGLVSTSVMPAYVTNGTTAVDDGANLICIGPK